METVPGPQAFDALLAFVPVLCAPGFEPVVAWQGGSGTLPWPEYKPEIEAFNHAVASGGWLVTDYLEYQPAAILADPAAIASANLAQVKAMLTFYIRGERFSDGHWAALIEGGQLCAVLQRLQELRDQAP